MIGDMIKGFRIASIKGFTMEIDKDCVINNTKVEAVRHNKKYFVDIPVSVDEFYKQEDTMKKHLEYAFSHYIHY